LVEDEWGWKRARDKAGLGDERWWKIGGMWESRSGRYLTNPVDAMEEGQRRLVGRSVCGIGSVLRLFGHGPPPDGGASNQGVPPAHCIFDTRIIPYSIGAV